MKQFQKYKIQMKICDTKSMTINLDNFSCIFFQYKYKIDQFQVENIIIILFIWLSKLYNLKLEALKIENFQLNVYKIEQDKN